MGGGGGGLGLSVGELHQLQEKAKKELAGAGSSDRKNVFISFASEDLDRVNLLRGQARNEDSGLDFNDWSLREPFESKNAEYIRAGIRERIRQSSVTLVFVSENTAPSRWVDWEIRESLALGKGVVGVYQGDSPPAVLPKAIVENNVPMIAWTHQGLRAAIEGADRNRSK